MLDILKATAAESEEKSDQIAENFLDRGLTIDEFLEQFKSSRTEMHLRKLKADKMQELLRAGVRNGSATGPMVYPGKCLIKYYRYFLTLKSRNSTGNSSFYGGPSPYPNSGPYPMMPMPPNYQPHF